MQLVLVTHRSRTSLKIADVRAVIGDDERALELPCVSRVYSEIAAQLHRASHPLGYIDERAVAEYGRVKRGIEVVPVWHDCTKILPYQLGMFLDGLADAAEDYALLTQLLLECGLHRHRVHDGIDSGATQCEPFLKWYAELVERFLQFRVYLLVLGFAGKGVGIIRYSLIVNVGHRQMSPCRLLQGFPVIESLKPELEHPFGFSLLL